MAFAELKMFRVGRFLNNVNTGPCFANWNGKQERGINNTFLLFTTTNKLYKACDAIKNGRATVNKDGITVWKVYRWYSASKLGQNNKCARINETLR